MKNHTSTIGDDESAVMVRALSACAAAMTARDLASEGRLPGWKMRDIATLSEVYAEAIAAVAGGDTKVAERFRGSLTS